MKKEFSTRTVLRRIISFAKPFKKALVLVFLCVLVVSAINALNNFCLSKIFDLVQKHGTDETYLTTAFWLLGGTLILVILRIVITGYQMIIENRHVDVAIPNHLNHRSIAKFFSFSNGQHVNEHSGVNQSIVNSGTMSIQNQINVLTQRLFPALSQCITAICVLCYSQWVVGILFIVTGVIFAVMMHLHNQKTIPGIKKIREQKILNSRLFSEMYRFVGLVKTESQEDRSLEDVSTAQQRHQDIHTETWIPGIKRIQKIRWASNLTRHGALFLIVYLLFNGHITIGALFLTFTYSSVFIDALWQLTDLHKQFLMDKVNIERYLQLLEVEPDIVVVENPIRPTGFYGKIEFRNVSFWYPQRVKSHEGAGDSLIQVNPVLKFVSFTIDAGQKVGIVGESGSGKSTLANLIRRGFDPQEGQIMVDGNDLRLLDLGLFLQHVGSVDQEVALFDRSIRDNILFGLNGKTKTISDERITELAKLARIDAFFSRLEHGFDTIVGEKGVKLSGGERQRIGIARALAKDPSILIFDEATSALDAVSERIVQQSIDEACNGKTAIIIAHRLSTVKNCDKIFVFRHGILLAEGTHQDLFETCEYYAELVSHQMVVA